MPHLALHIPAGHYVEETAWPLNQLTRSLYGFNTELAIDVIDQRGVVNHWGCILLPQA